MKNIQHFVKKLARPVEWEGRTTLKSRGGGREGEHSSPVEGEGKENTQGQWRGKVRKILNLFTKN